MTKQLSAKRQSELEGAIMAGMSLDPKDDPTRKARRLLQNTLGTVGGLIADAAEQLDDLLQILCNPMLPEWRIQQLDRSLHKANVQVIKAIGLLPDDGSVGEAYSAQHDL
jgi:hypothetical protein